MKEIPAQYDSLTRYALRVALKREMLHMSVSSRGGERCDWTLCSPKWWGGHAGQWSGERMAIEWWETCESWQSVKCPDRYEGVMLWLALKASGRILEYIQFNVNGSNWKCGKTGVMRWKEGPHDEYCRDVRMQTMWCYLCELKMIGCCQGWHPDSTLANVGIVHADGETVRFGQYEFWPNEEQHIFVAVKLEILTVYPQYIHILVMDGRRMTSDEWTKYTNEMKSYILETQN